MSLEITYVIAAIWPVLATILREWFPSGETSVVIASGNVPQQGDRE